jgi:hypothetical protein
MDERNNEMKKIILSCLLQKSLKHLDCRGCHLAGDGETREQWNKVLLKM